MTHSSGQFTATLSLPPSTGSISQYLPGAISDRDIAGENRFEKASTSSLSEFVEDIKNMIAHAVLENNDFLTDNIQAFMRTLAIPKSNG